MLLSLFMGVCLSCSDATAPPAPCSGPLTVVVASSSQPILKWSPTCGASELSVTRVPANSSEVERVVWGFTVSEQSPVGPGIVYGVSPKNATVWTAPEVLDVGRTYRVTVAYTVGGDVVVGSGTATFVWFPPD